MRAVGHYDRGNDSAITDYATAVGLDSSFLQWEWFSRAWGLYGRGQGPGPDIYFIAGVYAELLRKSPRSAEYHYQRGRAYSLMGIGPHNSFGSDEADGERFYRDAIADFSEAIELNPCEPAYYKARGNVYLLLGGYKKAASDHLKARRLDPNGVLMFLNWGGLPIKIKGYRAGIEKKAGAGKPCRRKD